MLRSFSVVLLTSLLLSACCKKQSCTELTCLPVAFYNFAPEDLDTIYTTGYAIGSGFTQVMREKQADTVRAVEGQQGVYMLKVRNGSGAGPDGALSDQYEWVIYLPSVNKTIELSDYDYSSYNCNKCGLRRGTPIRSLATVYVNSVKRSAGDIRVYK